VTPRESPEHSRDAPSASSEPGIAARKATAVGASQASACVGSQEALGTPGTMQGTTAWRPSEQSEHQHPVRQLHFSFSYERNNTELLCVGKEPWHAVGPGAPLPTARVVLGEQPWGQGSPDAPGVPRHGCSTPRAPEPASHRQPEASRVPVFVRVCCKQKDFTGGTGILLGPQQTDMLPKEHKHNRQGSPGGACWSAAAGEALSKAHDRLDPNTEKTSQCRFPRPELLVPTAFPASPQGTRSALSPLMPSLLPSTTAPGRAAMWSPFGQQPRRAQDWLSAGTTSAARAALQLHIAGPKQELRVRRGQRHSTSAKHPTLRTSRAPVTGPHTHHRPAVPWLCSSACLKNRYTHQPARPRLHFPRRQRAGGNLCFFPARDVVVSPQVCLDQLKLPRWICFTVLKHVPVLCLREFVKGQRFTAAERFILACNIPSVPCTIPCEADKPWKVSPSSPGERAMQGGRGVVVYQCIGRLILGTALAAPPTEAAIDTSLIFLVSRRVQTQQLIPLAWRCRRLRSVSSTPCLHGQKTPPQRESCQCKNMTS